MSFVIRPAGESDLQAILDIYNEQVETATATFDLEPRSFEEQVDWAKQFRHPYVLLVAEAHGKVAGWGCLHPFRSKAGYRFTTEDSVYVRADMRGLGIGKALLRALVDAASSNGFHTIIARIDGDNEVSVRLHSLGGFEHVGREREVGRKFDRWLDVVIMQRSLP
jgi:phosphinothricin acetyltransferase